MTEDEMDKLIRHDVITVYWWVCPRCDLHGDENGDRDGSLEDLRYHINEDHKGED